MMSSFINQQFHTNLDSKYGFNLTEYLQGNPFIIYLRISMPKNKYNWSRAVEVFNDAWSNLSDEDKSKYQDVFDEMIVSPSRYLIKTLSKIDIEDSTHIYRALVPIPCTSKDTYQLFNSRELLDWQDKNINFFNIFFVDKVYDRVANNDYVQLKMMVKELNGNALTDWNKIISVLNTAYNVNVEMSIFRSYCNQSNITYRGYITLMNNRNDNNFRKWYEFTYDGYYNSNESGITLMDYDDSNRYFPAYMFRNFKDELDFYLLWKLTSSNLTEEREGYKALIEWYNNKELVMEED